jgi:hypothetical protein
VSVERVGRLLLVASTLVVLLGVGVASMLSAAEDDLYASVDEARGIPLEHPRTQPGMFIGARLSADLDPGDISARTFRADDLSHRGDRVREAAGVGAVAGLLIAVLTGRPRTDHTPRRDASQPAPNTTRIGTV